MESHVSLFPEEAKKEIANLVKIAKSHFTARTQVSLVMHILPERPYLPIVRHTKYVFLMTNMTNTLKIIQEENLYQEDLKLSSDGLGMKLMINVD